VRAAADGKLKQGGFALVSIYRRKDAMRLTLPAKLQ
jgi:hypothetical protein